MMRCIGYNKYDLRRKKKVVIIYDRIIPYLHPLFTPDPCNYSRGLPVFTEKKKKDTAENSEKYQNG